MNCVYSSANNLKDVLIQSYQDLKSNHFINQMRQTGGDFAGRALHELRHIPQYMQADVNVAIGFLTVANAILFLGINRFANFANQRLSNEQPLSTLRKIVNTIGIDGILTGGLLYSANVGVSYLTQFPLSRQALAAITAGGIVIRCLIHYCQPQKPIPQKPHQSEDFIPLTPDQKQAFTNAKEAAGLELSEAAHEEEDANNKLASNEVSLNSIEIEFNTTQEGLKDAQAIYDQLSRNSLSAQRYSLSAQKIATSATTNLNEMLENKASDQILNEGKKAQEEAQATAFKAAADSDRLLNECRAAYDKVKLLEGQLTEINKRRQGLMEINEEYKSQHLKALTKLQAAEKSFKAFEQ